jgi:hypothetical protein
MKKHILTIVLALTLIGASGQKYGGDFGEMSEEDLRDALAMTSYPADTSASALILYNRNDAEVSDMGVNVKHLFRIKIFDRAAYEEADNNIVGGTIYAHNQGFFNIEGYSYSIVDGKMVRSKLDEANVFKTRHSKYTDKISFAMPNVKEGTVIEYVYSEKGTPNWPKWNLQFYVPALFSEIFFTNAGLGFRADIGGPLPVKYETLKAKKVHHWSLQNVPAFVREPYMPTEDLLRTNVQIWTYRRSWEKELEALWNSKYFGLVILQHQLLRDNVKDVLGDVTDEREKIKLILNHVKRSIEWNEESDMLADDPAIVYKRKKGTSGDINLILISMLAKSGIAVNPVLLSTRDNGSAHEDTPTMAQFNYIVCQAILGRDTLYLDATQRDLQYNCLPNRCVNTRALIAAREGHKWITLKPTYKRKTTIDANLALDASGQLSGKVNVVRDGYAASSARRSYHEDAPNYHNKVLKNSWTLTSKTYQNAETPELPFQEQYDLSIPDQATAQGEKIYINPFVLSAYETNPFSASERIFPVEFDISAEETMLCNINIPEGYVVEELPQSKVMAIPGNGVKAVFNLSATPKQIQVMMRIQVSRTFYEAEEYYALKEFYARLIAKQGEQIVLKKM